MEKDWHARRRGRGWKAIVPTLALVGASFLAGAPFDADARSGTRERNATTSKTTRISLVIPPRHASARALGVRRAVLVQGGRGSLRSARMRRVYALIPARPSLAQVQGLRSELGDFDVDLALQSSVALVMEEGTQDVLFSKNTMVALPIASITKLMTSLVLLDAHQPMDELVAITDDDLDTEKFSRSRLAIGTVLSRRDLLHLALMSSENRAAHALGRNYPGGLPAFVAAMNAKARALGMTSAHFHDPTGLSSQNVASAEDLVKLVNAASANATIREYSTDHDYTVPVGNRMVAFRNTNSLVSSPAWDIVVQKTGYITEAGKCLVMKAVIEGRSIVIVLLDSFGKYTRLGDANRVKRWMEGQQGDPLATLVKKSS